MARIPRIVAFLVVGLLLAVVETVAFANDQVVAELLGKLADPDSQVRSDAAAELRRLLAGDFGARTNNHGRLYWEERLRQVKPGMKHEEVLRILPPVDKDISGNWSGGTGNQHWRLDDYWVVGVHYFYPDIVHEMRPTLNRRARDIWVDPPAEFTGTWTTWHVNGQKAREVEYEHGKRNGALIYFYDNGRKCFKQHYVDGTCSGRDRGWYADGSKSYEGQYVDGKRDGVWTHWYQDGRLQSCEELRMGESHGIRTAWHENGQKHYESSYKNGKKHGPDKAWDADGNLHWSRVYRSGELID